MAPVLVTYATKYGSTKEVAGYVAQALRDDGVDVDLRPISDVSVLDGYSAAIIGAALYNHRWHGDAVRFISHNRTALTRLRVAVFAVGPVHDNPEEFDAAQQQIGRVLARWPWFLPVSLAVFGGRFNPTALRFPGARMLAKVPATDAIDPAAIAEWAHTLPEALLVREPATV